MKEFKVGDRVVMRGVVKGISDKENRDLQMKIDIGNGNTIQVAKDGKWFEFDDKPTIHHDDAKEFPRLMEVGGSDGEWREREIIAIIKEKAYAISPYTGDAIPYKNYREIQEPEVIELTIDQIAEKFGTKAELIKIKK